MPSKASPAANDAADEAGSEGRRSGRAARFQYGTGDTPLEGYTIKRGVGRGGFGEVYFATSDAGKEVALKLIRRNLDIELRGVRQCLNLKHPNLVSLYDLRTDGADDQWVVMEYVAGESLEEAIDRCPDGMPIDEAVEWLRGIAAGVAYLHSSGIVHRDLKPGNVYLERGADSIQQRVRIGDYGLSKFISTSRRSGQTESVGTVHYMAPEIAGGRYGREIDTYALGVILYEMLTGHVPFEGESVGEVLMKHLTAEPDLSRVAEPYRTIVARALAKDPELRLSSVEEMLALLPSPEAPATPQPVAPPPAENAVWSPVSRPPHTDFPKPPREPIWQYAVEMLEEGRIWWRQLPLPPLAKGVLFFSVLALGIGSGVLLALPAAILPVYIGWYVVWSIFFQEMQPTPLPGAVGPNGRVLDRPAKPSRPKKVRYDWRTAVRRERSLRSTRQKATTLTGSMIGSAVVAIGASAVAAPLLVRGLEADPLALGVWLATVTTLGSWGVLASSAAGETPLHEQVPRRVLQLIVGASLGAAAFGAMNVLGIELPFSWGWSMAPETSALRPLGLDLYEGVTFPNQDVTQSTIAVPVFASLAYFGLLFLTLRWWRSADFLRRRRVGVGSLIATVVGAWLLTFVSWYPQPLGIVLAGVIALATQVASPWCLTSRRAEMARYGAPTTMEA